VKPRFIQVNCEEGGRVDLRQARVVSRYKPDVIFFELPAEQNSFLENFNRRSPGQKPWKEIEKIKRNLCRTAKKVPYALSDVYVWENIEKLWRAGHDVLLYNVDAPKELRFHGYKRYRKVPYAVARRQLWFWEYLYVRERIMAQNIERILKRFRQKKSLVIAVFLQSIHWKHVQFLLTNPSRQSVWKYYFGRFPHLNKLDLENKIKNEDRILYKYWH